MRPCKYLSVALLVLLAQTPALAWNDVEHMIIGQMAYSRLNPTAKQKVRELSERLEFAGFRYTPVTMAVHMDDVRSDPFYDSLRPWHYVDIPITDDGSKPPAPESGGSEGRSPRVSVVTQIPYAVKRLRALAALPRPLDAERAAEEAQLLAFLMHMVGDAHQPLHCATRYSEKLPNGDAGGNAYALQGQYRNLHSFWDNAAGQFPGVFRRPLSPAAESEIENHALNVARAHPPESFDWQGEGDVAAWAQVSDKLASAWASESNKLARLAYNTPEGQEPSVSYRNKVREISRVQIAKAGYRLAALLNSMYPPEPQPQEPRPQQQQPPLPQQQQQVPRQQQQQQQQQQQRSPRKAKPTRRTRTRPPA